MDKNLDDETPTVLCTIDLAVRLINCFFLTKHVVDTSVRLRLRSVISNNAIYYLVIFPFKFMLFICYLLIFFSYVVIINLVKAADLISDEKNMDISK